MPNKPLTACRTTGCGRPVVRGGRCAVHQRVYAERPRPSAADRGYDAEWQQKRDAYLKRNPFCVMCGLPSTDVDHVVAIREGGDGDEMNLQALCHSCHSKKTAKTQGGWQHINSR